MDLKTNQVYQKIKEMTLDEDECQELISIYLQNPDANLENELNRIRFNEDLYLRGKEFNDYLMSSMIDSNLPQKVLSIMYLAILGYNLLDICEFLDISAEEVQSHIAIDSNKRWYKLWHSNVIYMSTKDSDLQTKKSSLQKNTLDSIKQKARFPT